MHVPGKRYISGETFHTDHSNHPTPPKATTMDPAQRILLRVTLPQKPDPAAIELPDEEYERTRALVETLMGRRPELRFEYDQKMPASPAISTFKDHLRKSAAALN